MKLYQLFHSVEFLERKNWHPYYNSERITSDSRLVGSGDVFVAVRGARMDGHDFINQAIQAKASTIVYEGDREVQLQNSTVGIRVSDSAKVLSQLLRNFHGHPDRKVKLVGVTGTNGKTTIAYLLHTLLRDITRSAYLGTLWYEMPHQKIPAVNTTPGPEILIPLIHQLANEHVETCSLEVSSHALHQGRVNGLQFEVALFTQLTQDHLDYHGDLENYFRSKKMLFKNDPKPRRMLINIDCPFGMRLASECPEAKTFSMKHSADYFVRDVESSFQGSRFIFCFKGHEISFQIRLPFIHNVYNVAEVLGTLDLLGYHPGDFKGALQEVTFIPGRMERVPGTSGYDVFVDYAHTPDAFENVLSQSKRLNPKRIITVFGCGGDRDRMKRPMMGKIAAEYSDIVICTSDNPRTEDPESILKDILKGISPELQDRCRLQTCLDRRGALQKAIQMAQSGDVILILGKGHENYQILGDTKIDFDDRKVIQECLERSHRVPLI